MSDRHKFFVGNWKMFGIPTSFKIFEKINKFYISNKKNNKNYKIIIAPPFTLLSQFKEKNKMNKISISAQNCFFKDNYGSFTGSISPFMIKKIGIDHVIIGHSENRALGENEKIISEKVSLALKNKLTIIFCIGENLKDKKAKKTFSFLKKQISSSINANYDFKKILFAYEPIWSIGSGKVPNAKDLKKIVNFLKNYLRNKFKLKFNPYVLYGGSVDKNSVKNFKTINDLDGFLIGGASKSSKNFIDIIKNFYK